MPSLRKVEVPVKEAHERGTLPTRLSRGEEASESGRNMTCDGRGVGEGVQEGDRRATRGGHNCRKFPTVATGHAVDVAAENLPTVTAGHTAAADTGYCLTGATGHDIVDVEGEVV